MARTFAAASTDKLRSAIVPITAVPLTMACWFKPTGIATTYVVMSIGDSSAALHFHSLVIAGAVAGDPVRAESFAGGVGVAADTSTSFSASTWQHGCVVFASATDRRAFLNGGGKGTNATSRLPNAFDNITVGARANSTITGPFDGDIAEAAMWNVALADADVALLAKGIHPTLVHPESLVFYAPVIGRFSPEIDIRGSANLTVTGTVNAVHPPIVYRKRARQPEGYRRTRFYLPSTGAAVVSPSFDAGWEETGSADRIAMDTSKISSSMTDKTVTTLITPGDDLVRQFVSRPLSGNQTIRCRTRLYARATETLGTVDAVSKIVLKVVSNDGSTVRGTLLAIADYSTGSEFNTSITNKSFTDGDVVTSVAALDTDRLVLEIGFNHGAVISSASINFGDNSGTDLNANETDTAANNPWLDFLQAITLGTESTFDPAATYINKYIPGPVMVRVGVTSY